MLRYGDNKKTITTCEQLESGILNDFPIEAFLQRGDILKTLLFRLEKEKEFAFCHFAFPILRKIIENLKNVYKIYCTSFSRPSELPILEKSEQTISKTYLECSYPAALITKYDKSNAEMQNKIYIDSMSALSALSLISIDCIKAMKEPNKLGFLMTIFSQSLEVIKLNYENGNEKVIKELYVPVCNALVDVVQHYGIVEICTKIHLNPIVNACIWLWSMMSEDAIKICYKHSPKCFAVIEEAAFYDLIEDHQVPALQKIINLCNPHVLESLKKVFALM